MNNTIRKIVNGDFEIIPTRAELREKIHKECINIINSYKEKHGSKDNFFKEKLGIYQSYYSLKINGKRNFTKKDLKILKNIL